jgi:hypothetical protein
MQLRRVGRSILLHVSALFSVVLLHPEDLLGQPGRDSVEYSVDQLGGKTLMADSSEAFTNAVLEIARVLARNQ